jgi:hypothetical protein
MNQTWKKVVTTLRQLELQQLKLQLSNFVNQIINFDFDFNCRLDYIENLYV